MFIGKVSSAKSDSLSNQVIVELEITRDDEIVTAIVRNLAFPAEISESELKKELKKYVDTYNADYELGLLSKVQEEKQKKLDSITKLAQNISL